MTTLESPERLKKLSPEKRALLLKALRRDTGAAEGISRRLAAVPVPVSFAQGRLWLLDQITPGNPAYNVPFAVRLSGGLDVAALAASLDEVERRHEALRTVFAAGAADADGPVQVVGPPAGLPLPVVDLGALSAGACDAEARRLVREDARRSFDLARGPLVRATLLRLATAEHLLLFNLHHIVTDGWSNGLLISEVAQLYAAAISGSPSPLPELPVQYADFALWQRQKLSGETLERLLAWWRRQLDGAPAALELPADHPRPAHRAHLGGAVSRPLPASLVGSLEALGRSREATLFMVLLAGFQVLLGRSAGVEDLVVGSVVAGRSRAETERLIGFFANTLALRGDLSGDPSFAELIDRARRATLDGWDHGALPFEKLVEELRPGREAGGSPLFQVALVLQNAPRPTLALPGLTLAPVDIHSGVAKFDLTLSAEPEAPETPEAPEGNGGLTLWLEHSRELFETPTAVRLLDHLETLLRAAVASPGTRLSELSLLGAAERHQLLLEWEAPAAGVDAETTVHGLVEAQAAADPEAPALLADGLRLTYAELERRANRLAHHLIALGLRADTPVGVALERSADLTVTLLGVLKAGGAYLPLDPSYPDERLVQMLDDADPPLVVTRTAYLGRFGSLGRARLVAVDGDAEAIAARGSGSPAVPVTPDGLAYILYTSGSTGRPKGVAIPHRGVVRLVRGADFARRGPRETFLQFAPIAFDASTLEIWGALANGACLAVMPAGSPSLPELEAALQRFGVTTLWLTAGLFHQVVDERMAALRGVRRLLTGGDVVSPPHARRLLETFPGHTLIDAYGPTENTTFTCCHWMREPADVGSPVPIGRPARGNRAYVLDRTFRPVPIGVPGELCAGGDGLARGYVNLPALTAERFVPDPWSGFPGERLYRTGDRVRFLADGRVEFLGRLDHQVKVRGFRLEPEEIETVLATHPAVRQATVVAVADPHGDKRLAAYVVQEGEGEPVPALKAWLGERLPAWMVPALWMVLPEMPLTANGKVDRRALPDPAPVQEAACVAPRTPLEEVVAGLWADVLGLESVGVEDDFFELGGHSLLATRITARVQEVLGIALPLAAMFDNPTVAGMAARVESARRPEGVAVPRGDALPLSFAQERLWFLDRLEPGGAVYNMPAGLRLRGGLHAAALEGALAEIVRRHEALRTVFAEDAGQPVQIVLPAGPLPLPLVDLSGLGQDQEAEAARLAENEARRPFDLAVGPLLRTALLRLGPADHQLLICLHHIVSDGWSNRIFIRELSELYGALAAGLASPLPALPMQYADFAIWQRSWLQGEALEAQLAWWRQALAGAPPALELPADRPRPASQTFRGGVEPVDLPVELLRDLRALARREGASLFMTVLAGYAALLSRYSGQEDVVVGSPVAGRSRSEVQGVIGFFANTLPLRVELGGEPSLREMLGRVRGSTLKAYGHQDVPFERLVQELQPQRDLSRSPLFQTMLAFQDGPVEEPRLAGLAAEILEPHTGTAKFELTLALSESRVALEFNSDLFDAATARRLAGGLVTLLAGASAAPELSLFDLPLLTEAEARQVLVEWNATASPFPAELGLHELFERQAARTPEAVALIHGAERLSYRDLDAQAERLADRLHGLGVGPEVRVAVLARRTPAMVTALLAVLKAGGAYVPLDPGYPAARVALVLEDSAAPVLLTEEALVSALPPYSGEVVLLDGDFDETEKGPRGFCHPEQLAYLIYTSGSTGKPKGVAIRHASAVAMVSWAAATFPAERLARVLASTSICFDLSVFELFVPLAAGGAVVLADDILALPELAAAAEVTLVNTVPSGLAELVRAGALPGSVRTVNLAGEPLRRELVSRLYESPGVEEVYNLYGPSEDTTYSTGVLVARSEGREPSIGRPLANARVYVLDSGLRPVPLGAAGELWLGGEGLARGYLGRPDLTAERFRPDPFGGAGGRLYRTGDLARWLAAGELEFLGRLDHQVKVRGFRIELGEIEAALARHPGVAEAAVVAREDRLVGYVAPALEAAELRVFLRQSLPEHMVPSSWVVLAQLPRTPNGKVDRRALPAILERPAERRFTAPRTPVEELLAGIWSDLLRVERVGADDDFFDLGGHSLLATQVVSRLRGALGVELPLRSLFEAPTVAALAARVEAARSERAAAAQPLVPVPRGGDLPISFSQERLWILDRFEPGSTSYNISGAVRLAGGLDVAALRQALAWLVRRHETLRTTFVPVGGGAAQRVAPDLQVPMPPLPVIDLRGLGGEERRAAVESWAQEVASTSFDLARGPLLRVLLLALEEREHALLLAMHHIVSDGWSTGVLIRELAAAYAALAAGREPSLPDLAVQYGDFAVWQRERLQGKHLAELVEHWRSRLAGAPPALELPTDRPRPAIRTFRGGQLALELPAGLSRELRALSRRHGATLFMTLLAAFDVLLGRLAGQEDVVVGVPIAGRERPEVQGLIGMFLNTLVLRADLSGAPAFAALLAAVRETALAAYAHQELPFEKLLDELRPERDLSRTPLFQVFFNVLNFPRAAIELPGGLTVEPLSSPEAPAKFDLTVYVSEPGEGIRFELVYNADLFDQARIAEMARQYEAVLAQAVADPEIPIDRLSLVTPATSATAVLLPDPRAPLSDVWMGAVHERFAEWARRDPGRPAVVDDRESWTYGELNERADRLAHRLRTGGVAQGDVVAIYGHRSARLVWAVLGVMKAGAAFTVLDPAHPPARQIDCLSLATPRGWIELAAAGPIPQALSEFLAESGCLCKIVLPLPGEEADLEPIGSDPLPEIGPDDVAYVAFTSGSTGIPKGILGRHGPLSHFIPWQKRRFGLGETDRFSMLSGLAHDPLQRDMFTPLQIGGTICVPDPADIAVPGRLAEWMRRQRVTVAHLTPAMGQILTEIPPAMEPPRLDALRWAFLVGDVLTRRDVARLRELAPNLTCVNFYGSTETQRSVGYHEVGPGEAAPGWRGKESLPLGRGVEGVQLLVVNRAGERAGVGELGEIYVRGHHLARGYLGDPESTAAKFLDNPFGGRPGDRVYRTGDLGRYLPDGEVEFAGRADFQVKIRGFRIEPGEIEALLARHAAVRDCAVLARDAAGGEKRLVAYVVPERPGVTAAELRTFIKERLPDYMVPSTFVLMEKLPVTPNNKLDRRALPDPAEERAQDGSYVAPRNEAERKVAEVLREVLAIDKVGLHDNFFELGGSSLQLVRVHSRLREVFAREMQVFELFTHPTVAALAGFLSPGEASSASGAVAVRELDRTEELQVGKDRRRMRFEKMRQRA